MGILRTIGFGFAWSTSGVAVGKVIGLVNTLIILTYLSVYEYGLVELTLSVISTLNLFLLPGLTGTIIADLGVERGRQNWGNMKALFLEYFVFSLTIGVVMWAFVFFGSSYVAHLTGNDLIDWFFKIVSFLFLVAPWRMATTILATVMVRYADQSFFSVVEECCKAVLLVVFFFVFGRRTDGLLFAIVLSQCAAVLLFLPRTLSAYRIFGHALEVSREPLWRLLREHRKWSVASSYVGTIGQNMRLWLIKFFLGTEAVGLFAFAYGILGHLSSLQPFTALITPLVPGLIDKRIELVRLVRASIKLQLAIAFVVSIFFVLFGYWFIAFFFPKYLATMPLIYTLLAVFVLSSFTSPLTPVFNAYKDQKSFFISSLIKVVIMLATLPIALPLFGLVGVGIELCLTVLGNSLERFYRCKRLLPEFSLHPREFFSIDSHERYAIRMVMRGLKSRMTRG